MHNNIFTIGPITIHGYGLMIGIGVLIAIGVVFFRARKQGIETDHVYSLIVVGLIFGILGAKILYCIIEWRTLIIDPWAVVAGSGFVVYGGIIGGIIAAIIFARVKSISFLKLFDLIIPEVAIAQGFGRIGCLLAGCCYGRETDSILGIVFHNSDLAPNDVSLIPTQIIFCICAFALAIFLITVSKYVKTSGVVGALYVILYSAGRFFLEYLRGDYRGTIFNALSTSQSIAIIVFIMGICYYGLLKFRKQIEVK